MKFLLDESADYPLGLYLKELGHDVTAIAHDYPHALVDEDVLETAFREKRILIANDKDFGELIFRQKLPHYGVILFRLHNEPLAFKKKWIDTILAEHAGDLKDFLVVTDAGIRVRKS